MRNLATLVVLALGAGCSGTATAPERSPEEQRQIADSKIVVDVRDRLSEDAVPGHMRIRVESAEGTVTLTGDVPSREAAAAAEASAKKVDGVRGVVNRLAVKP